MITVINPTAADKLLMAASIDKSNAVNAWLIALQKSDVVKFENVRKLPFEEIAVMAGL